LQRISKIIPEKQKNGGGDGVSLVKSHKMWESGCFGAFFSCTA